MPCFDNLRSDQIICNHIHIWLNNMRPGCALTRTAENVTDDAHAVKKRNILQIGKFEELCRFLSQPVCTNFCNKHPKFKKVIEDKIDMFMNYHPDGENIQCKSSAAFWKITLIK